MSQAPLAGQCVADQEVEEFRVAHAGGGEHLRYLRVLGEAGGPGKIALGFAWQGDPSYPRLRALAEGILAGRSRIGRARHPLVLLLAGDVARSLGRLLRQELGLSEPAVILDGLDLAEFDYVDIGQLIRPSGTVPVTIKSLLFGTGGPERRPERQPGRGSGHPARQPADRQ